LQNSAFKCSETRHASECRRRVIAQKFVCTADIQLMIIQHLAQISMQRIISYTRQQFFELSYDPGLAAVQKAKPIRRVLYGHRLGIESAAFQRRFPTEALNLPEQ